jgi:hypothetical protein
MSGGTECQEAGLLKWARAGLHLCCAPEEEGRQTFLTPNRA